LAAQQAHADDGTHGAPDPAASYVLDAIFPGAKISGANPPALLRAQKMIIC
jgi:hypothetical protein